MANLEDLKQAWQQEPNVYQRVHKMDDYLEALEKAAGVVPDPERIAKAERFLEGEKYEKISDWMEVYAGKYPDAERLVDAVIEHFFEEGEAREFDAHLFRMARSILSDLGIMRDEEKVARADSGYIAKLPVTDDKFVDAWAEDRVDLRSSWTDEPIDELVDYLRGEGGKKFPEEKRKAAISNLLSWKRHIATWADRPPRRAGWQEDPGGLAEYQERLEHGYFEDAAKPGDLAKANDGLRKASAAASTGARKRAWAGSLMSNRPGQERDLNVPAKPEKPTIPGENAVKAIRNIEGSIKNLQELVQSGEKISSEQAAYIKQHAGALMQLIGVAPAPKLPDEAAKVAKADEGAVASSEEEILAEMKGGLNALRHGFEVLAGGKGPWNVKTRRNLWFILRQLQGLVQNMEAVPDIERAARASLKKDRGDTMEPEQS